MFSRAKARDLAKGFGTEYELEVYDKNNKVIKRVKGKGNTLLMNFYRILASLCTDTSISIDCIDPTGFRTVTRMDTEFTTAYAPDADDSFGIVVGSGSSANTSATKNLDSKISHGTTTGRLYYRAVSGETEGTFPTLKLVLIRRFENQTSADITVREIGLVVRFCNVTATGALEYFKAMIARDVLTTPVTVPAGGALTVKYKIRIN